MAKLLFLLVVLTSLVYVSAVSTPSARPQSQTRQSTSVATSLSQWVVDVVSRKIVELARFFNLKVRIVKFLVSLFTTENLVLLRNIIEYEVRFLNYSLSFLPRSVDDPLFGWVPVLTQFADLSIGDFGDGGLVGALLGQTIPEPEDESEEAESEIFETVTNPPVYFNKPSSSAVKNNPLSNEVNGPSSRKLREIEDPSTYQTDERAFNLHKLINARK